jgi:succinoglycan biosynthesis transport protein ExoP
MIERKDASRLLIPRESGMVNRMVAPPSLPFAHLGAGAVGPTSESLLAVAWRNRWVILICLVAAIAAGFVYVRTATPIYTSVSQLYLDYVNVVPPTSESGRPPQTERYLQTQAGLLRSRPIVAAAIQPLEQRRLQTFKEVDIPAAFVAKNIRIDVGKKDDIITIAFDCPFPAEAAQIVNCVVEAYMTSRSQHEQRNAAQVLEILQKDLDRVEKERLQRQTQLEDFQTNHMPLSLGSEAGSTLMQRRLEDLQTELARAQAAATEAEAFRDAAESLGEDAGALGQYVQVKGNVSSYLNSTTEKSSLENRLTDIDLRIGELSDWVPPDHPTASALTNQRDAIQARLKELNERFVATVRAAANQRYREAVDYETQLKASYEEQRKQIALVSAEIAQYRQLRSEVDRLTEYAQTLEQQVGEIARIVNEDVGLLRMAILEPALPAENPSSPQKAKVMAIALVLGLMFGGGIAISRDWFDQTLRSVDEIPATLGLAALGVVPTMSHREAVQSRGRKVFLQPRSHESEAFRTIRTAVFFSASRGGAKTLLVTSPASGDGKSTLVSNLGIAMATAGQRTIILDADLRRPVQHVIFEVDQNGRCLEDILRGKVKLAAAICSTEVKGLSVLVCRGGLVNPAEILGSTRFARLLQHLTTIYDRVLLDAPPVTVVTDAQILAALCKSTVLVLKANKTTKKMARQATNALQSVGAHILGVVVNQVPRNDGRYGYYGRYRYMYDSGSNGGKGKPTTRAVCMAGAGGRPRR